MELQKDRTYNIASDCFRDNRYHWCFSPPNRTSLWLGRVQQLPYFGGMLHYHGSYLSQSANGIQSNSFTDNRKVLYEI